MCVSFYLVSIGRRTVIGGMLRGFSFDVQSFFIFSASSASRLTNLKNHHALCEHNPSSSMTFNIFHWI